MKTAQKKKITALAKYLGINSCDIEANMYGMLSRTDGVCGDYYVYTEKEATKAAKNKIRNELWAFRTSFIMRYVDAFKFLNNYEWDNVKKSLKRTQEELCESANELVYAMLGNKGFRELAEDAISEDGLGHFLASYDGEENEIRGTPYFVYCENC